MVIIKEAFKVSIKNEIKSMIYASGWNMVDIVHALNEKYNRADTIQNLSNKLSRGTLRYKEVLEIAEILGYKIAWVEDSGKQKVS